MFSAIEFWGLLIMTTNKELSILAKAMGNKVRITDFFSLDSDSTDCVAIYDSFDNFINRFAPKESNNQFVEVFHFVLLHGSFQYLAENETEYKVDGAHEFFRSDLMTIQENIINIAIQLAKYLSEVNNDL